MAGRDAAILACAYRLHTADQRAWMLPSLNHRHNRHRPAQLEPVRIRALLGPTKLLHTPRHCCMVTTHPPEDGAACLEPHVRVVAKVHDALALQELGGEDAQRAQQGCGTGEGRCGWA